MNISKNNSIILKSTNTFMKINKHSLANYKSDSIHKNSNIVSLHDNVDRITLSKEALFKFKQRKLDENAKAQEVQTDDPIEKAFFTKLVTNIANATLDQIKTDIEDNLKAYSSYVSGIKDGTIGKNVSFNDYADVQIKKKYQSDSLDILKTSDSKADTSTKVKESKPNKNVQNFDTIMTQAFQQLQSRIKKIVDNSVNSLNNIFSGINVSSKDLSSNIKEIEQMITSFTSSINKINLNSTESKSEFAESLDKTFEIINKTQNNLRNYSYTESKNVPGLDKDNLCKLADKFEIETANNLKRYQYDINLIASTFI